MMNDSAQELKNLKEAIIDLYLAIKIRSTEEVGSSSLNHPPLSFFTQIFINGVAGQDRRGASREREEEVVKTRRFLNPRVYQV